ncbi:MAG: hypothetical protein IT275_05870 [Chitinophagales bacterium]|nr:hypothetical protein [Chitinophagales bacterium]
MKSVIQFFVLIFLLLNSICTEAQILQPTSEEKIIIERFEYIRQIKKYVGNLFWKNFSNNEFPGTVVYFTDSASYFINPLPEMKDKVSKYAIVENDYDWNIWKLRMPLDSAKFVMETQFQFDPKAKAYINYRTPVLFCSSPELTRKEKVVINTTQEWAIALMHELYHQYQYSNEAILTYVLRLYQEKKMIDMDSLQTIYLSNQAFRDTLKLENEILKKAVAATSFDEEKKLFTQFLKMRTKRGVDFFKKKKFYISTPENFWEKLEGTSLMMEHELKQHISEIKPTPYLLENDPMCENNFKFDESSATEIDFYTELNDERFYVGATGFNMVRLLEKNKVPYKDNFFSYASLPLELQLKYFYKIK